MAERVLVTGSRKHTDRKLIADTLSSIGAIELLIHGDAEGADRIAGDWAAEHGIPVSAHPAAWDRIDGPGVKIRINRRGKPYNALAGFNRNQEMLAECPTLVIGFPIGDSPGTMDMLARAQRAKRAGAEIEIRVASSFNRG